MQSPEGYVQWKGAVNRIREKESNLEGRKNEKYILDHPYLQSETMTSGLPWRV